MKRTPLRRKRAFTTSSSTKTRATPMRRCDDLARAICRARGKCEAVGTRWHRVCKGGLQWAHVIPRTYHATRHDEDNARLLCLAAHVYFTYRPVQWVAFIGEDVYLDLHQRALHGLGVRIDWKEREAALKARLDSLGGSHV